MAHAILSATGMLDEKIRPEFKDNLKIYVKITLFHPVGIGGDEFLPR